MRKFKWSISHIIIILLIIAIVYYFSNMNILEGHTCNGRMCKKSQDKSTCIALGCKYS